MKIGISLSGGGFRATVFHLGVLARLAEQNLLEQVAMVSSVSGGSLCAGLVFAKSDFKWPTSTHLIEHVVPQVRHLLTTVDLQFELIWRVLLSPLSILKSRATYLSSLLNARWGINAKLRDLPKYPRWLINATTYETGKNWRFESFRMGDYVFGYTYDNDFPVSDAMAASAGFPGLIGALELDARRRRWFRYLNRPADSSEPLGVEPQVQWKTEPIEPEFSSVHLWDGGVYDNFGLEGLFDLDKGWRKDIDFLIASDASGKPKHEIYQPGISALLRIITGVMMDQVRSLRARAILERITIHHEPGAFLMMGNTCEKVLSEAGRNDEIARLCAACLDREHAAMAADTPTMIRRLSTEEFDLLFRHGHEVADYTLHAYHPDNFKFVGYANSHFAKQTSS